MRSVLQVWLDAGGWIFIDMWAKVHWVTPSLHLSKILVPSKHINMILHS